MKRLWFGVLLAVALSACGVVEEAVRRNDDRLMQPGALDSVLSEYYDVYRIPFLGKYRITHEWPVVGNCEYGGLPTRQRDKDRYQGEIYAVSDIYEEGEKTWQRFTKKPYDFSRFVRSVKFQERI